MYMYKNMSTIPLRGKYTNHMKVKNNNNNKHMCVYLAKYAGMSLTLHSYMLYAQLSITCATANPLGITYIHTDDLHIQ